MADWNKFWELVDQETPPDAVRPADTSKGIYGDYLVGQFVKEQLNQVCRESGLRWKVDWPTVRTDTMQAPFRHFVSYMTGDLVITDGTIEVRRPGMGVGRCMCPYDKKTDKILETPADHQMDTVMKSRLTDFIKNAAMRLGRYFGGELYFDERLAGVLGWEIAGNRPRQSYSAEPEDLDSYTIHPGGWGKDKKFGGMSLKEVYENTDGYGAMSWAATLDVPKGATAKMAQYFKMREAEGELEGYAEGITNAVKLISRTEAESINGLIQTSVGEGELFGHAKHVRNHLKKHFRAAKVVDLTVEQADAFARYIQTKGKERDPRWYGDIPVPAIVEPATFPSAEAITQPVEELFGPESIDDLLKKVPGGEVFWAEQREKFGVGEKLNAKQSETVRFLLEAIASGNLDPNDTEGSTYEIFVNGMNKVAANGISDIPF